MAESDKSKPEVTKLREQNDGLGNRAVELHALIARQDDEAVRLRARVTKLEAERAAILGMSADCDGNSEDPVQAVRDALAAIERECSSNAENRARAAKLLDASENEINAVVDILRAGLDVDGEDATGLARLAVDRVSELEAAIVQANVDFDEQCLDWRCVPLERLGEMVPERPRLASLDDAAVGKCVDAVTLRAERDAARSGRLPPAAKVANRFWSDDPEGVGMQWHRTWEEARRASTDAIASWSDPSICDNGEWPDEIEAVRWGIVIEASTPVEAEAEGGGVERFELQPMKDERHEQKKGDD